MCKLRILSALFALLFCGVLSAQDVISTKDGREIEAKVLEVGTEELVYKKWSNPDGPDYHILLSDVLQVRYENGEVETYGAPGTEAGMVRRFRTPTFISIPNIRRGRSIATGHRCSSRGRGSLRELCSIPTSTTVGVPASP